MNAIAGPFVRVACDCGRSSVTAEGRTEILKMYCGAIPSGRCSHCGERFGPPWPENIRPAFGALAAPPRGEHG